MFYWLLRWKRMDHTWILGGRRRRREGKTGRTRSLEVGGKRSHSTDEGIRLVRPWYTQLVRQEGGWSVRPIKVKLMVRRQDMEKTLDC